MKLLMQLLIAITQYFPGCEMDTSALNLPAASVKILANLLIDIDLIFNKAYFGARKRLAKLVNDHPVYRYFALP
jgi:hypothetical protein